KRRRTDAAPFAAPSLAARQPRARLRYPAAVQERSRDAVSLDIQQILAILPHRFPFVLVDRVTEVVAGRSIRGHKCIAFNEPWFQGHFPGRPIFPGVLILEAMAQIGGILAYASDPFDPQTNLLFFLGI